MNLAQPKDFVKDKNRAQVIRSIMCKFALILAGPACQATSPSSLFAAGGKGFVLTVTRWQEYQAVIFVRSRNKSKQTGF